MSTRAYLLDHDIEFEYDRFSGARVYSVEANFSLFQNTESPNSMTILFLVYSGFLATAATSRCASSSLAVMQ